VRSANSPGFRRSQPFEILPREAPTAIYRSDRRQEVSDLHKTLCIFQINDIHRVPYAESDLNRYWWHYILSGLKMELYAGRIREAACMSRRFYTDKEHHLVIVETFLIPVLPHIFQTSSRIVLRLLYVTV